MTGSRPNRLALRRFGWSAGLTASTAVLYLIAVQTRWGQRIDEAVVNINPYVRISGRFAHQLGIGFRVTLVTAAFVAGCVGVRWALRSVDQRVGRLVGLVVAGGGSWVATEVLRTGGLPRPELVYDTLQGPSFPSGHAAAAIGVAMLVLIAARGRPVAVGAAVIWLTAADTLILVIPMHRPSDVIASNLLGMAAAAFGSGLVHLVGPTAGPSEFKRRKLAGAALAGLVFGVPTSYAAAALIVRTGPWTIDEFGSGLPAAIIVTSTLAAVGCVLAASWASEAVVRETPGAASRPSGERVREY